MGTQPCIRRPMLMSREPTSWIRRLATLVASEATLIALMFIILAVFLFTLYGASYLP